jgi:hypothetical protein
LFVYVGSTYLRPNNFLLNQTLFLNKTDLYFAMQVLKELAYVLNKNNLQTVGALGQSMEKGSKMAAFYEGILKGKFDNDEQAATLLYGDPGAAAVPVGSAGADGRCDPAGSLRSHNLGIFRIKHGTINIFSIPAIYQARLLDGLSHGTQHGLHENRLEVIS